MLDVTAPADLTWLVWFAAGAMAFMAWGIGANDVANSFGTAFGAKAITARQAVAIAAVCELAGAVLMGASVASTIRKGMMDVDQYAGEDGRTLMMAGMTSVLVASGTWLLAASKMGLPVSTTHSAVGGVVAFAIASKGWGSVKWGKVGLIVASWVISPVMSGIVGYMTYWLLQRFVLSADDVLARAKVAAPCIVFLLGLVVSFFTIYKGGKGIGLDDIETGVAIIVSIGIALFLALVSVPVVKWWIGRTVAIKGDGHNLASPTPSPPAAAGRSRNLGDDEVKRTLGAELDNAEIGLKIPAEPVDDVERLFQGFVVIVSAFMSLAHGANDVANSVGPFGAVLAAYEGELGDKTEIDVWVFLVAGFMICVGLGTYGYYVMQTIGSKVTPLDAKKAFCANWAATLVILIATWVGIPVSTTHASVGAVMGVGMVGGKENVDWAIMIKIFTSWIVTLPICALAMAGVFAFLLPCVVDVPFETYNASCVSQTTCSTEWANYTLP